LEEEMTIRRVQGSNVPYTYPDPAVKESGQKDVRTSSEDSQNTAEKSVENRRNQTSQIGELKQEGTARSLELNSKIPNSTEQSVVFKGDIVGLEPYAEESNRETSSSYSLPEVDDEVL